MTQRLHYLLLTLTVLLLGQVVCTAQEPAETAEIELIVPKGALFVNFEVSYLRGAEASSIDFGDGTVEKYNGQYQSVHHSYATALAEETVIKIDAARLTQLRSSSVAAGFSGFGKIVAR